MRLEITIPEELGRTLPSDPAEAARAAVEALALEGYRARRLTEYQLQVILGLQSRLDVHAFLKEHETPLSYALGDLLADIDTSRGFETAGLEEDSNAA